MASGARPAQRAQTGLGLQNVTTQRLLWAGCFALLTGLYLLPLWLFPYVPTLDGPVHLESAQTLRSLAAGESGVQELFLNAQWRLATNQLYALVLYSLGALVPMLVAEKLVLSLYVIGFGLALVFALRGLRGAVVLAAFLGFPVVYSYIFYIGFHNLCFGLPLFIVALGLYFRLADGPPPRRTLVLAVALAATLVLLYYVHVIATACTLLALGLMALLGLFRGAWRTFLATALAALPTAVLVLWFLVAPEGTTGPVAAANTATDFLTLPELVRTFFIHAPRFVLKAYIPLVVHSWVDVFFLGPWNLLLLVLGAAAVRLSLRTRTLPHPELLATLSVFLFIILWTPTRLGEAGWLTERFLPFGYLLFILWIATVRFSPRVWRVAAGAGIVTAGALIAYRIPVHAMLVADIREYVSASRVLPDDATVLPLNLPAETIPTALGAMYAQLRYDALGQAMGYVALERRVINLRNYQAAKGYFPLVYDEARNPALFLSERGYNGLGRRPFAFDLEGYRRETGAVADFVLVWGDLEAERSEPDVQNLLAQLSNYRRVYVSEPRNLMQVYKRVGP